MDRLRIAGTRHQIKGRFRQLLGRLTGNRQQEAFGSLEKHAGKLQKAFGKARDASRQSSPSR